MVHRRDVDGQELVFGNQGDLWQNAMTLFDHGTGSVWAQPTGEAIMGPRKGDRLDLLPSTLSTWTDWRSLHPETLALDVGSVPRGFRVADTAVVTVVEGESLAVPVSDLVAAGIVQTELGGEPLAFVNRPGTEQWVVYSRRFEGDMVDFEFAGDRLVDRVTGREFNTMQGFALDGSGSLQRLPAFSAFPADYEKIFPDGRLVTNPPQE